MMQQYRHTRVLLLLLVLLGVLLASTSTEAKFVRTPGATLKLCYFYFGAIDDLGWTFTFNIGRLRAQDKLRELYPDLNFESVYDSDAFFNPDKDANVRYHIERFKCDVILANTNWAFEDELIHLPLEYPNISFVSLASTMAMNTSVPNRIHIGMDFFGAYYMAGVAAALEAKHCVGMITARESWRNPNDATNGFLAGIRSVNQTLPVHIIPTGSYFWPAAEVRAAELLLHSRGCNVVGRYTDPRAVDVAVSRAREKAEQGLFEAQIKNNVSTTAKPYSNFFSIGPHSNLQEYVGDSVLLAIYVDWATIIVPFISEIVVNGSLSHRGNPYRYGVDSGAVTVSPVSDQASTETVRAVDVMRRNATNQLEYPCLAGNVTLRSGRSLRPPDGQRCLTYEQVLTVREFLRDDATIIHPQFVDVDMCKVGTFAQYTTTGLLVLQCVPCPMNTFASDNASLACLPCPDGMETHHVGSSECTPLPPVERVPAWAITVFVMVVTVSLMGLLILVYRAVSDKARHAPTIDNSAMIVVFISVNQAIELWDKLPTSMPRLMARLQGMIQKAATQHKCYQVKNVGEAVMIVARKPENAIDFVEELATTMHKNVDNWRILPLEQRPTAGQGGRSSSGCSSRRESSLWGSRLASQTSASGQHVAASSSIRTPAPSNSEHTSDSMFPQVGPKAAPPNEPDDGGEGSISSNSSVSTQNLLDSSQPSQVLAATNSNASLNKLMSDGDVGAGSPGANSNQPPRSMNPFTVRTVTSSRPSSVQASDQPQVVQAAQQRRPSMSPSREPGSPQQPPSTATFAISIGIAAGRCRVIHNTSNGTFDYRGAAVDTAARACDIATGSQILVAQSAADAFKRRRYGGHSVEPFCCIDNKTSLLGDDNDDSGEFYHPAKPAKPSRRRHGGRQLEDNESKKAHHGHSGGVQLYQFNIKGIPPVEIPRPDAEVSTVLALSSKEDSIAVALEQRETGLAHRRIAVLVVRVDGMVTESRKDKTLFISKYQSFATEVQSIVKDYRGHLSISGELSSQLVITYNAVVACGSQVRRAVSTAMFLKELIEDYGWRMKSGFHSNTALVGTVADGATERNAVISSVVDTATYLAGLCYQYHGVSCVATSLLKDDLYTCAYTQTLDFVHIPDASMPVDLVGVMSERTGDLMEEWMYELEMKELLDPFARVNAAFALLRGKQIAEAQEMLDSLEHSKDTVDHDVRIGIRQLRRVLGRVVAAIAKAGSIQSTNTTATTATVSSTSPSIGVKTPKSPTTSDHLLASSVSSSRPASSANSFMRSSTTDRLAEFQSSATIQPSTGLTSQQGEAIPTLQHRTSPTVPNNTIPAPHLCADQGKYASKMWFSQ